MVKDGLAVLLGCGAAAVLLERPRTLGDAARAFVAGARAGARLGTATRPRAAVPVTVTDDDVIDAEVIDVR